MLIQALDSEMRLGQVWLTRQLNGVLDQTPTKPITKIPSSELLQPLDSVPQSDHKASMQREVCQDQGLTHSELSSVPKAKAKP